MAGIVTVARYLNAIQTIIKVSEPALNMILEMIVDGGICIEREVTLRATFTDEETTTHPVHHSLAPSFAMLEKESGKKMDKELKVIIAATMRALLSMTDQKWESLLVCMKENALLEYVDDSTIYRSDTLIKNGYRVPMITESPRLPIVEEVNSFFAKLIQDKDVLKDTKINIGELATMAASTGTMVTSFMTFFLKKDQRKHIALDVGVLQFPDSENPYIKLYRIQLQAWKNCTRVLFVQKDANWITGEYQCVKFKPRESVIRKLRSEILDQAVSEAEAFLSDPRPS